MQRNRLCSRCCAKNPLSLPFFYIIYLAGNRNHIQMSAQCSWVLKTNSAAGGRANPLKSERLAEEMAKLCWQESVPQRGGYKPLFGCLMLGGHLHLQLHTPPELLSGSCTFLKVKRPNRCLRLNRNFILEGIFQVENKNPVENGNHYRKWHWEKASGLWLSGKERHADVSNRNKLCLDKNQAYYKNIFWKPYL